VQVASLGAAVLVMLQLAVAHWFYLYIVWFTPFVLVALFARYRGGESDGDGSLAGADAGRVAAAEPALA
jgi:hypothetical protein